MGDQVLDRAAEQDALLDALVLDAAAAARAFAGTADRLCRLQELAVTEAGPEQFPQLELAGTIRIGQFRADSRISNAVRLRDVLAGTLRLLSEGLLFVPQAEQLLSLTSGRTEQVARELERRILARPLPLGPHDARRLIAETILAVETDLDPALTVEREGRARGRRRVWASAGPDGMGNVGATITAEALAVWCNDFDVLVRLQHRLDQAAGVQRNHGQRSAAGSAGVRR